jgi:chemotaxis protein MotA
VRTDVLTPIGILAGFAVIFTAIYLAGGYDGLMGFVSLSSFFIVVGGLIASLFVSFGFREIRNMLSVVYATYRRREVNLQELINLFADIARSSREDGVVSIEKYLSTLTDPFMKKGIAMIVDGYSSQMIRQVMAMDITALQMRHARGQRVLAKAGELSPAWGMVGTIIGLVLMLRQIDNPDAIGPAVAVALITTFYGLLLANLVFNPIVTKLGYASEEEVLLKEVIIEALVSINEEEGPGVLRNKLQMFLANEMHRSPLGFAEQEEVPHEQEKV